MNQNEVPKSEADGKKIKSKQPEIMMSEFLSAISETEYPSYILEAVGIIREWMNDAIEKSESGDYAPRDIFAEIFGNEFDDDDTGSFEDLYKRLGAIEDFADLIPNTKKGGGKSDAIIISLESPDYESGLRAAIDYAAVFNRSSCHRVWIISDSFTFGEVVRFVPHVDALAEQGITLRFLLVTPWGWVEMPLSGSSISKQQFLWKTEAPVKRRRKQ